MQPLKAVLSKVTGLDYAYGTPTGNTRNIMIGLIGFGFLLAEPLLPRSKKYTAVLKTRVTGHWPLHYGN
jgi:hypothetical protein